MPNRMNVKVCYLLCLVLALAGCSTTAQQDDAAGSSTLKAGKLPQYSSPEDLPKAVPANPASLDHYQVPPNLAGLKLKGEISSAKAITLQYQDEGKQESLYLVITAIPAGWDNMAAERAVASYYSEVRQRRVNRALSDSANALTIISEQLMDLEGQPSAQAQLRWVEAGKPIQNQSLLVTRLDDAFIRISNASYKQNSRWLLQQAKRALAEFKAAQKAIDN